jgi:AcrR family transcriptional regulator
MRKPRGRPKSDPDLVLDALTRACAVICRAHGFAEARVDDIAAAAGVAKAILFRVAGSKDALIAATLDRASAMMREALTCSPRPRVILERALAAARGEPALFFLLFQSARGHPHHHHAYDAMAALTAERLLNIPFGARVSRASAHQRRTAQAMTALLHEGLRAHVSAARPRDDAQFLDWAEAMVAAWAKTKDGPSGR